MSADPQPLSSVGEAGVWRPKAVADELESLFIHATGRPSGPSGPVPPSPRVQALAHAAPERRTGRAAALGGLVAAGLVGLAFGALMVSPPSLRPARAPAAAPVAASLVAPTATPADVLAVAEPVLVIPQTEPGLVKARTLPSRAMSACGAARCSHADLMAADRRLRKAYSRAVSAGVPRAVLVNYRNRWASLRHDAVYRPDRVANGYGAMTGDLNRMANRRRPPRRSS